MKIDGNSITLPVQNSGGQGQDAKPLQMGESLKAQVLFVSGDKANIKLDNGVLLRNVQLDGVSLKAGDTLTLTVSDAANGQLTLKVEDAGGQAPGGAQQADAGQVLSSLGLEANARNLELVTLMLSRGMQVTPETLQNASMLLDAHPALTPEQAVFLVQNEITDPKLVEAFARLVGESALTGSELTELSKMLEQAGGKPDGAQTAQGQAAAQQAGQGTAQQAPLAAENQGHTQQAQQSANAQQGAAQQQPVTAEAALRELARISPEAARLISDAGLGGEAAKAMGQMLENPSDAAKTAQAFVKANFPALSQGEGEAVAKAMQNALPLLELAQGGQDALAQRGAGAAQIERMLSDIESLFARVGQDAKGGEALRELSARLQENLLELRAQIASQDIAGKAGLLQKLDQTITQTRVMSDVSQYAMVQIPVTLNEHKSTAELYVMKRGGKKPIDPEDVTVVVALDTQHMGRVESVIRVERKSVSLHAKVEKERIAEHIRTGSATLYALLGDIGYKLADFNARLQENRINPLNVEEKTQAEYQRRPLSLDFKI